MPRAFSSRAMASEDVYPDARIAAITGAIFDIQASFASRLACSDCASVIDSDKRERSPWTMSFDHGPPRAARMPRAFNSRAMAADETMPEERISATVGTRSEMRADAFANCTCRALAKFSGVPKPPRKPPSFTPRALAAARPARVRSEINPCLVFGNGREDMDGEAV